MFKKLTKNIWFNVIFIIILACFALVFALYDSYQVVFDRLSHLEYWKIPIIIAWGVAPYLVYALVLKIFALPFNKKYKFKTIAVNDGNVNIYTINEGKCNYAIIKRATSTNASNADIFLTEVSFQHMRFHLIDDLHHVSAKAYSKNLVFSGNCCLVHTAHGTIE